MVITKDELRETFSQTRNRKSFRFDLSPDASSKFRFAQSVHNYGQDIVTSFLVQSHHTKDFDPNYVYHGLEPKHGVDIRLRAVRIVRALFEREGIILDPKRIHSPAMLLSKMPVSSDQLLFVLTQSTGRGIPYRGYCDLDRKHPSAVINLTSAAARFGRFLDAYLGAEEQITTKQTKSNSSTYLSPAMLVGAPLCAEFFDQLLLNCTSVVNFLYGGLSIFSTNDVIRYYAILRAKQEWQKTINSPSSPPFSDLGFLYEVVYGNTGVAFFSDPIYASKLAARLERYQDMSTSSDSLFSYLLNQRVARAFNRSSDELVDPDILAQMAGSSFVEQCHLPILSSAVHCPAY